MNEKLNPQALSQWYDEQSALPENVRPGVQSVTRFMILDYVREKEFLPEVSADPFSEWAYDNWFEYENPDNPAQTNDDTIQGMLAYWRGQ